MEIEDNGDPKQDLTDRFEALATTTTANDVEDPYASIASPAVY